MKSTAHHKDLYACLIERGKHHVIYTTLSTPDSVVIYELRDNAGELICMSAGMDDIVDAIKGEF